MRMRALVFLSLLLSLVGLASAQDFSPENLQKAAEYSEQTGGVSLLVLQNGERIFEQYREGVSPEETWRLASGTKSFAGLLALAAVEEGLLDLDEPVADTITEWKQKSPHQHVTVSQLLHLESGVQTGGERGRVGSYQEALKAPFVEEPGERFQYGAVPFQVFGELLSRKLATRGETVEQFLHRRFLDPLEIRPGLWKKDSEGNPYLPHGAKLKARDWAKIGELVRQQGEYQGRRLLPRKLLGKLSESHPTNPCYGLTWWMMRPTTPELQRSIEQLGTALPYMWGESYCPQDLMVAAGAGQQRLYVSRERGFVIVRQAPIWGSRGGGESFRDDEFLSLLFSGERTRPAPTLKQAGPRSGGALFRRWDSNKDGYLQKSEVPERFRGKFSRVDRNDDLRVSPGELEQALEYWRKRP